MLKPTLKAEDVFPSASPDVPFQITIAVLDNEIAVQDQKHRMKIPAGSMLVVNLTDDNPRNHTPFRVSHPQWGEFFWIGRQQNTYQQWVVVELAEDGHSRFKFVDAPVEDESEWEDVEETTEAAAVSLPAGAGDAACCEPGCCDAPASDACQQPQEFGSD